VKHRDEHMTEPATRPRTERVLAPCPDCGDVRVDLGACTLLRCAETGAVGVAYLCPRCNKRDHIDLTSQPERVPALLEAGVVLRPWHLPTELFEPRPEGAPFDTEDLLDWHLRMDEPDWLDELHDADH
jgi:predicted RNA-binding Zn-ribbon protein involved in translation (DUF1610 family)